MNKIKYSIKWIFYKLLIKINYKNKKSIKELLK